MRTHPWNAYRTAVPANLADEPPVLISGSLQGRRIAVESTEPDDAHITGMTRSLDRRLLALNLHAPHMSVKKVA